MTQMYSVNVLVWRHHVEFNCRCYSKHIFRKDVCAYIKALDKMRLI